MILSMVAPDPAARVRELVGAERWEELGIGVSKDLGGIDRLYGLVDRIDKRSTDECRAGVREISRSKRRLNVRVSICSQPH